MQYSFEKWEIVCALENLQVLDILVGTSLLANLSRALVRFWTCYGTGYLLDLLAMNPCGLHGIHLVRFIPLLSVLCKSLDWCSDELPGTLSSRPCADPLLFLPVTCHLIARWWNAQALTPQFLLLCHFLNTPL